jgi:hypothetical protein
MPLRRLTFPLLALLLPLGPLLAAGDAAPSAPQIETIIVIRHGEKPKQGLGNLDIQGLNRALALPAVLLARYGKPAYIFAPDPGADEALEGPLSSDGTHREGVGYVRPLLTIGPTAIQCGLPIYTSYGYKDIDDLEKEFDKPPYRAALIFVAWEHVMAERFMRNLLRDHGGNPEAVPVWADSDYDSIYIARITRDARGNPSITFQLDHEGLNGLSDNFPKPAGQTP